MLSKQELLMSFAPYSSTKFSIEINNLYVRLSCIKRVVSNKQMKKWWNKWKLASYNISCNVLWIKSEQWTWILLNWSFGFEQKIYEYWSLNLLSFKAIIFFTNSVINLIGSEGFKEAKNGWKQSYPKELLLHIITSSRPMVRYSRIKIQGSKIQLS